MKIGIAEHNLVLSGDFITELYIVRRTIVMFLDQAVIRRPLRKETKVHPFRHALRYFSRWQQPIDSRGCL
jgi:hypothetical protein